MARVTIEQAREALSSMDDFAQMPVSVDAMGPRGVLERFIAQYEHTPNTYAGWRAGFVVNAKRPPEPQEIWNAGVASGLNLRVADVSKLKQGDRRVIDGMEMVCTDPEIGRFVGSSKQPLHVPVVGLDGVNIGDARIVMKDGVAHAEMRIHDEKVAEQIASPRMAWMDNELVHEKLDGYTMPKPDSECDHVFSVKIGGDNGLTFTAEDDLKLYDEPRNPAIPRVRLRGETRYVAHIDDFGLFPENTKPEAWPNGEDIECGLYLLANGLDLISIDCEVEPYRMWNVSNKATKQFGAWASSPTIAVQSYRALNRVKGSINGANEQATGDKAPGAAQS